MLQTKQELFSLAESYEQEELFEQMVDLMKFISENYQIQGDKERNLFCTSWKKILDKKINSRRKLICSYPEKEHINQLLQKIENEIIEVSTQVIQMINKQTHPKFKRKDIEDIVFFANMKAYCHSYMAELKQNNLSLKKQKIYALNEYQYALQVAEQYLSILHPIRLEVVNNFSVFLQDAYDLSYQFIQLSKKSFDDAIEIIEQLTEENYQKTVSILQKIRDTHNIYNSRSLNDTIYRQKQEEKENITES